MNNETGKAILPFKVQQLVDFIMKKKKMNSTDALYYLYSSELYKALPSENTKYWYMSIPALYELLEEEKLRAKEADKTTPEIMLFLVFCIESYKDLSPYSAEEVISLFKTEDVFDFLTKNFDILHTQGKKYIVEEIELFLNKKKEK